MTMEKSRPSPDTQIKLTTTGDNYTNMSNLNSDDYYKILGVGRSATEAELKKAYRKLSIKVGRMSDMEKTMMWS